MGFITFLLQGIPIVGKITDAFTNYTNKKMDSEVEKYKVKGSIDVAAMQTDTEVIKARAELAAVMKDDPATKWGRWFFIVPTGVFYTLTIWDSTGILRDMLTFRTLELPEWMKYMPYAVVAYLFVTAWRK